jgi:chromosome segregation ATPase
MKSSRGVQQEDVSQAADALLASGLRPTIERVRQHLGRGSPNTVSPMLETWFVGLGKRLGMIGGTGGEGQMPATAAQALAKLWEAALLIARKEADASLSLDRQALSDAQATLSDRETSLLQQEQALTQRQDMANQLLQAEREKTAAAEASLANAQQQLRARDATVLELRAALAGAQEQLQAARDRSDAQGRRHAEERTKWEERAAGNERRLLGEIDRERQTSKEANAALEEATARLQTIRSDLESRTVALGQKLHVSEMDLANARHALALSEHSNTEVSSQLQEQRTANAAVHEQLNQALAAIARGTATPKRRRTIAGTAKPKP